MKKKIFLMALIVICCTVMIWICADYRGNNVSNAVKNQMLQRIEAISERTDQINIAEYTPFIWDEVYVYGSYSSKEGFEKFAGDKNLKYINTNEYDHREIYFYEKSLVYDTELVDCQHFWTVNRDDLTADAAVEVGVIFFPDDWLRIELSEYSPPDLKY